jgi:hypothetical protein
MLYRLTTEFEQIVATVTAILTMDDNITAAVPLRNAIESVLGAFISPLG